MRKRQGFVVVAPVLLAREFQSGGYSDADLLASYPTLTASDLANDWICAAAYAEEIEAAIQAAEWRS